MTGRRVVLIIAREGGFDSADRLASALAEIERGGYELVALVDPEQRMDAVRMVVDDLADLVVVTDAQDFPVRHAIDLNDGRAKRTGPALRPSAGTHRVYAERRTEVVRRTA